MENNELHRKVYEKIGAELQQYKEHLLSLPPEEILEHALDYAIKQKVSVAADRILWACTNEEVEALLSVNNLTETIYDSYLDTGADLSRPLADCFIGLIKQLTGVDITRR